MRSSFPDQSSDHQPPENIMVLFLLRVKGDLENVTNLQAPEGMAWCLDLKHPSSDEVKEKVVVSPDEKVDIKGSKGEANLR